MTFLSQPWAIITSLFVHDGIWHIVANMLTLYFFGSYLKRIIGEWNFFFIYLVGGLLGNILFLLMAPAYYIAVGASGAVFAVAGALVMLRPKLTVFIIPIPIPIPLWVAVLGGFLLLSFAPHVAWQAHLGGMVLGLAAGFYFKKRPRFDWSL
ncbi:rhomboid family intramembrane serine protease [Chloroflexota bacterium]